MATMIEAVCEYDTTADGVHVCKHCKRPVKGTNPPKRSCPKIPFRRSAATAPRPATPDEIRAKVDLAAQFKKNEVTKAFAEVGRNPLPLGDMVETVAKKVGADKVAAWYSEWTGKDCGCNGRKAWLNAAGSWLSGRGWKVPAATTEPVVVKRTAPIAVIIPCHNYGRFLEEAIASVRAQTVQPAELLVVNDASTDDTAAICDRLGVRRIDVDVRSIHGARTAGFNATSAPWVSFFDADDILPADYLEQAEKQFATGVGVVFSDCQNFGLRTERLHFQAGDISQRNFIHAASVARRVALESARVFDRDIPACTLEDWSIWRAILADGWRAVKSPAVYRYRRHGDGHTVYLTTRPHYEVAGLATEKITIAIPLSGRAKWWPRLRDWLNRQTWPKDQVRLVLVNTSADESFAIQVRGWMASCDYDDVQYVRLDVGLPGLADADRHREEIYRGVQRAMPRIYNEVRRRLTTNYVLIVEDDVLPPDDAVERLLRSMDDHTVSVSGAYRSRYQPGYVAWDRRRNPINAAGDGVQTVGGNGFGCVLMRASVLRSTVLHHGGQAGDFDPNFYADIDSGWVAKLDWGVRCDHAGIVG